jgi:hypothetical protein
MNEVYFVITASEDGEVYLNTYTKAALEKALTDEDWGPDVKYLRPSGQVNLQEGGAGIYIIKGNSVIPKEQAVVTKWSV